MPHHLAAGHKVILPVQHIGVRPVERAEDGHGHPGFIQHQRVGWPRPASEVQPLHAWVQSFQGRQGEAIEKATIPPIPRVVLMSIILLVLPGRHQLALWIGKHEISVRAVEVNAAPALENHLHVLVRLDL